MIVDYIAFHVCVLSVHVGTSMWPEDYWTLFLSSHPQIFESLIIPRLNNLANPP